MKAKQILGIVLFTALIFSLGYKLNASLSALGDQFLSVFLIILIVLFFVFAVRFILSR